MPRIANRSRQDNPEHLASKLLKIRLSLGLSQGGVLKHLEIDGDFERGYVSKWERGLLLPPLYVLCAYATAANIFLEVLVRDDLKLPIKIPAKIRIVDF